MRRHLRRAGLISGRPALRKRTRIREKHVKEKDRNNSDNTSIHSFRGTHASVCFFTTAQGRVSLGGPNGKPISHQYILLLVSRSEFLHYARCYKVENRIVVCFKKAFSISCKIVRAFGTDRRPIMLLEKHLYSIREKVCVIRRSRARHAHVLCGKIRSDFLLFSFDRPANDPAI